MIKVSVCIPIYNVSAYIERCARSLFGQTCREVEYIFIDDCSPDNSVEILRRVMSEYAERMPEVRIVRHEQNRGLSAARNTAVEQAKGEYIMHVDSDDYLAHDSVVESMILKAEETNADIVEADYVAVTCNGKLNCKNIRNSRSKDRLLADVICKNTQITIWNKLIRRRLYVDHNISVPDRLNNGEDYVTLPRLMYYAGKIEHIDDYTYCYNLMNVTSFSSNRKNWDNLRSMVRANRCLLHFFSSVMPSMNRYVEAIYLETKAYRLLYSTTKQELSETRQFFSECKYRYFFGMRWKYQVVLMLNFLRLDRAVFWIGRSFRR